MGFNEGVKREESFSIHHLTFLSCYFSRQIEIRGTTANIRQQEMTNEKCQIMSNDKWKMILPGPYYFSQSPTVRRLSSLSSFGCLPRAPVWQRAAEWVQSSVFLSRLWGQEELELRQF